MPFDKLAMLVASLHRRSRAAIRSLLSESGDSVVDCAANALSRGSRVCKVQQVSQLQLTLAITDRSRYAHNEIISFQVVAVVPSSWVFERQDLSIVSQQPRPLLGIAPAMEPSSSAGFKTAARIPRLRGSSRGAQTVPIMPAVAVAAKSGGSGTLAAAFPGCVRRACVGSNHELIDICDLVVLCRQQRQPTHALGTA
ncbi:hypothetical protein BC831DRAFT_493043, partial [Entophlyctis helioformis]